MNWRFCEAGHLYRDWRCPLCQPNTVNYPEGVERWVVVMFDWMWNGADYEHPDPGAEERRRGYFADAIPRFVDALARAW